MSGTLLGTVATAVAVAPPEPEPQARAAVHGFVAAIVDDPRIARLLFVEPPQSAAPSSRRYDNRSAGSPI